MNKKRQKESHQDTIHGAVTALWVGKVRCVIQEYPMDSFKYQGIDNACMSSAREGQPKRPPKRVHLREAAAQANRAAWAISWPSKIAKASAP
jgi:hypothetical protein